MDKRRKELALIGVGALVVLVALYLTFRPRTQPAAAQTPAPAVATAQPQPGAAVEPAPEPQADQPSEPELVESGAATTDGRDPFRPIVMARAPAPSPAPTASSQAATAGIPPLPVVGPWGPQATGQAGPPANDRLHLTGVVRGDPSIAVLRKGSKRFFVTIGDPVDSEYTVKSISEGRVVLAGGEKTLSLTLGGRK